MQKILLGFLMVITGYTCCFGEPLVVDVNATGNKKSILFIGDSISVGVGASVPANKYTTLVTDALNQKNKGYEYEEINFAISCLASSVFYLGVNYNCVSLSLSLHG